MMFLCAPQVKLVLLTCRSAMTNFSPNIRIKSILPEAQTLNHSGGWISMSLTQIINGLSKPLSVIIYLVLYRPSLFSCLPHTCNALLQLKIAKPCDSDECGAELHLTPESTETKHDDRKPARVLTSSVALEDQQGFPSTDNHPIPPSWSKKQMMDLTYLYFNMKGK